MDDTRKFLLSDRDMTGAHFEPNRIRGVTPELSLILPSSLTVFSLSIALAMGFVFKVPDAGVQIIRITETASHTYSPQIRSEFIPSTVDAIIAPVTPVGTDLAKLPLTANVTFEDKDRSVLLKSNAIVQEASLVHARLPLSVPRTARLAEEPDVLMTASMPMPSVYRPDFDKESVLPAIAFPFAGSAMDLSLRRPGTETLAERVLRGGSRASRALITTGNSNLDELRFGDTSVEGATSFAPIITTLSESRFEDFVLGSAKASWRPQIETTPQGVPELETRHYEAIVPHLKHPKMLGLASTDLPSGMSTGAPSGAGADVEARADDPASAVVPLDETEDAFFEVPPNGNGSSSVYDALKHAAKIKGLSPEMTEQLVTLLSAEFDFHEDVGPSDLLDVYFSPAGVVNASHPELYFIRATFGGTYRTLYRFRSDDGTIGYYGSEGRSARQLLLRNPVSSGVFQSGFGMRRHPILGYERMHDGVDWSAPRGTPVVATASGTVERSSENGGYGLQILIRHENGYTTSYAHLSALADSIVPNAYVRQGEVIGFVGSSGLATGPHIHYEVALDGVAIDPTKVPASNGPMLTGSTLDAFLAERDRIDGLAYNHEDAVLSLAEKGL